LESAIKVAVRTGKVLLGFESVKKELLRGKLKAIIYSKSLDEKRKEELVELAKLAKVNVVAVDWGPLELGRICEKPFPVSTLGFIDFGQSELEKLIKK